ncbi:MAG: LytR C-terminal domain-containing protein [bacterium]|nr:LytR C-terminal domain-containing protein [bacterium]
MAVICVGTTLILWRPWEPQEETPTVETHNGETAMVSEVPEGKEPPDEIVLPRHYSVEVWHTPADAEKLNDVEYQLSQLGQTEYSAVPVAALGTGNVNVVYYHGESEELRSFAERLSDLLGFGPPRRVDLSVVLGRDIENVLAAAPDSGELPGGASNLTAEVLNGSGVPGMGSRMADKLGGFGLTIVDIRNNSTFDCERTTISCTPDKLEYALALKKALGLPGSVTGIPYDLQVVLGGG